MELFYATFCIFINYMSNIYSTYNFMYMAHRGHAPCCMFFVLSLMVKPKRPFDDGSHVF